jgi:hypothetical protein
MDYERKYKDALEWMRSLYDGLHGATKEEAEHYFPELKESEDERIRNFLIDFIKVCTWTEKKDQGWPSREDCLAWLEKQGEQKPTLPKWKYKKDHIPLLKDSLILNKYGCVGKSPSGAIVSDVWVLDYDELAKLPKGGEE